MPTSALLVSVGHWWHAVAEPPADELRVRIRRHLLQHPGLTSFEIARALKVGEVVVRRRLKAMEADGEAEPETTPKGPATSTPVTRWKAT